MRVVICTLFSLLAFIFATSAWSEDLPRYTDHEITTPTPLLNPDGILKAWGWARHPWGAAYLVEDASRSAPA